MSKPNGEIDYVNAKYLSFNFHHELVLGAAAQYLLKILELFLYPLAGLFEYLFMFWLHRHLLGK